MKADTIMRELKKKQVYLNHFFGRELVTVKYSDFEKYKENFSQSKNIFNSKKNYRTNEKLKHIHAIKTNNLIEIHFDYGNVDKGFLLYGTIHIIMDIIPFFLYHLFTLRVPYKVHKK